MDYRGRFLQEVERELVGTMSQTELDYVMNTVTRVLREYEISERCTDIALADNTNEKLLAQYCACLRVDGRSEGTVYQYRREIERLAEAIGKPFTEMGVYDIRYYLGCEKQRGISNVTLENSRQKVSIFFQWLSDEEIIPKNVCRTISHIKVPKEVKKPFSDVEIDTLRSNCDGLKERALVEFLLSTGVRVNELCTMDRTDVDFTTMTVHVRHGKGSKERITYVNNVGREYLAKYLATRTDSDPALFINYRKNRISTGGVRAILNKVAERAGVFDVYPHRFRRTFATGLASRGMPIQEISKLLGHEKIVTTQTYVAVDGAQVHASYQRFIA